MCQVDLLATFAALAGKDLPPEAGPDSFNLLVALLGGPRETGRDHLIEHAGGLALRKGPWKFMPHSPKPPAKQAEPGDKSTGPADPSGIQLFNLTEDAGETKNIAEQHPELTQELSELLDQIRKNGRSRP